MAKIIFNAQELKTALGTISAAVGAGKVNPAEKNIYVRKKDDNRVEFQGSNMYLTAQIACDVKGNTPDFDEFAVDGKKITAFISKLADDEITFEVKGKSFTISTATASIKLSAMPDKINPIDVGAFGLVAEIAPDEFKAAVGKAIVCTMKSETRPSMAGINFAQTANGEFELQSCDGRRLAVVGLPYMVLSYNEKPSDGFSHLVPAEAISTVLSMASSLKGEEKIAFKQAGRSALFEFGGVSVRINLITDAFVNIHDLIPKNYEKKINVDSAELKNALDIVSLATEENRVPLKVTVNKGTMKVATASTTSAAEITIPLLFSTITEDFVIGFNAQLLSQVVKTFAADVLKISFGTEVQGALIESENHTALVLPVRLRA